MKTIACVNQKGGVGKTTTVINIADGLAREGRRVLVVDLDPQANATDGLGIGSESLETSIYDVIMGQNKLDEILCRIKDNLWLAPSCISLAGAEVDLLPLPGKDQRLKGALAKSRSKDFDYILIDCPPSLGQLTLNALSAAEEVYIPVQCGFFSLKGVGKLLETIDMVREWSNPTVKISGVILTMFDARKSLQKDIITKTREHFEGVVFETVIPLNVAVENSPAAGLSVFDYDNRSEGAKAYLALCQEILKREG